MDRAAHWPVKAIHLLTSTAHQFENPYKAAEHLAVTAEEVFACLGGKIRAVWSEGGRCGTGYFRLDKDCPPATWTKSDGELSTKPLQNQTPSDKKKKKIAVMQPT